MSGTYELKGRFKHSAPVIGDSLYLWAGGKLELPVVHDSPLKRELTSTVETFSFSSARWSSHLTRGTPPFGIIGYSCTIIRSNIYYYAGWCGHDNCYHNSLNVLNTLTMSWTQLHPNDESMMKKTDGGMLSLELDGTDYLFMVGGSGPIPPVKHPQFQYEHMENGSIYTNEQLLYNLSNRQFTVPSVSGECCTPNIGFTIDKINQNKGIMFGGPGATYIVFIFTVTRNIIHWESIKKVSIFGEGLWTKRIFHASAIINGDSTSPALVVIGGTSGIFQQVTECLLFDNITTGQFSFKKIPLPESVTGRYSHSLTAVTMSPNCVWLVIIGGDWVNHKAITDADRLIMIVELVHIEPGEWIVQSILDGNDLTSKKYQEKYSSYSKTRTWWMDQLIEYPTEKEMKLQRYIQSLHQELQVAHQSKVSLQEALTETNKQGSTFDGNNLVFMNEKLEDALQEKQILTEDIEKLRAAVAYNEVYITELEEEKKQLEEEKRQLEEQLMEKQITKGTGMADPVALNTHRARRNLTVPVSPSKNPTTYSSSSTTITEATALSTGGASISATVDVNKVKNVIDDVLVSHYADLTSLPIEAVPDLANQLFALRLVNNAVKDNPSIKKCIDEFKASLKFMRKLPQVEEHCQKFLSSFIAVRGSYANAAIALGEGWIEAIRNELRFDFNINIDT